MLSVPFPSTHYEIYRPIQDMIPGKFRTRKGHIDTDVDTGVDVQIAVDISHIHISTPVLKCVLVKVG